VDLEALAAFLSRRGLLLRSASMNADEVCAFSCYPAPTPAAEQSSEPSPPPAAQPPEPDGLEAYLSRKKREGETL
jgi:hypothetical protein